MHEKRKEKFRTELRGKLSSCPRRTPNASIAGGVVICDFECPQTFPLSIVVQRLSTGNGREGSDIRFIRMTEAVPAVLVLRACQILDINA